MGTEWAVQGCGHGSMLPEFMEHLDTAFRHRAWILALNPHRRFPFPHAAAVPESRDSPLSPSPKAQQAPCTARQAPAGSEPPAREEPPATAAAQESPTPPFPNAARRGDLRALARQHADHPQRRPLALSPLAAPCGQLAHRSAAPTPPPWLPPSRTPFHPARRGAGRGRAARSQSPQPRGARGVGGRAPGARVLSARPRLSVLLRAARKACLVSWHPRDFSPAPSTLAPFKVARQRRAAPVCRPSLRSAALAGPAEAQQPPAALHQSLSPHAAARETGRDCAEGNW